MDFYIKMLKKKKNSRSKDLLQEKEIENSINEAQGEIEDQPTQIRTEKSKAQKHTRLRYIDMQTVEDHSTWKCPELLPKKAVLEFIDSQGAKEKITSHKYDSDSKLAAAIILEEYIKYLLEPFNDSSQSLPT